MQHHVPIINVSTAFMLKRESDMVTAPLWKWASTEHRQFQVFHLVWSEGYATAFTHNQSFGSWYRQYHECQCRITWKWASTERQQSASRAWTECQQSINRASPERQQSVNRASTERQLRVNNLGCCILYDPRTMLRHLPIINLLAAFMLKETATWSQPHCENERQQSVNEFGCCILYNPRDMMQHRPLFKGLASYICHTVYDDVASPENERQHSVNTAATERQQSIKRASTGRQQSCVFHLV